MSLVRPWNPANDGCQRRDLARVPAAQEFPEQAHMLGDVRSAMRLEIAIRHEFEMRLGFIGEVIGKPLRNALSQAITLDLAPAIKRFTVREVKGRAVVELPDQTLLPVA